MKLLLMHVPTEMMMNTLRNAKRILIIGSLECIVIFFFIVDSIHPHFLKIVSDKHKERCYFFNCQIQWSNATTFTFTPCHSILFAKSLRLKDKELNLV
jgi:hypothetical protein